MDGYSLGSKFAVYIDLSAEVAKYLKLPAGTTLSLADMCTRTADGSAAPPGAVASAPVLTRRLPPIVRGTRRAGRAVGQGG